MKNNITKTPKSQSFLKQIYKTDSEKATWIEKQASRRSVAYQILFLFTDRTYQRHLRTLYYSHATIAKIIGCGLSTVKRALAQLRALGFIKMIQRRLHNKFNAPAVYVLGALLKRVHFRHMISHLIPYFKALSVAYLLSANSHGFHEQSRASFFSSRRMDWEKVSPYIKKDEFIHGGGDRARYARERGGSESLAISWELHRGSPDIQYQLQESSKSRVVCKEKVYIYKASSDTRMEAPHHPSSALAPDVPPPKRERSMEYNKPKDPLTDELHLNQHGLRKAFLFRPDCIKDALETIRRGTKEPSRASQARKFFDLCVKVTKAKGYKINWREWYDYCDEQGIDPKKVTFVDPPRHYQEKTTEELVRTIDWQSEEAKYAQALQDQQHLENLAKLGLPAKNIFSDPKLVQERLAHLMNEDI